jgi:hypothetical protein
MTKIDLTYTTAGMFTIFSPETTQGEVAWREIASRTEGTGKILTIHLASTLSKLRDAGYVVRRAKVKTLTMSDDELLNALMTG